MLLREIGARRLILTGIAGNFCVLLTANDAYLRDYELLIPADCVASNSERDNRQALKLMQKTLKADIRTFPTSNSLATPLPATDHKTGHFTIVIFLMFFI
jgi:nicotinamidase-related amidase